MEENSPPAYLPPPAPGPSLGCFAKGCLTVAVVGVIMLVLLGFLGWYMAREVEPYLSKHPAVIRVYPATPVEYQTLEAKLNAFVQTVNGGHRATLTLTADELNTLIARDPRYASLRGKAYFAIANDEIAAETNIPLNDRAPEAEQFYFHGRIIFDASFASGDFTVVPRRLEPLNGGPAPAVVKWVLSQPNFATNFSRGFNENFHETLRKNSGAAAIFDRLRTIIVKDNQLVITTADDPGTVAGKADQR